MMVGLEGLEDEAKASLGRGIATVTETLGDYAGYVSVKCRQRLETASSQVC